MNLWDNLDTLPDNLHTPDDATEHGHTRALRTRRLSEQAMLSLLRAWLLEDYAATYCRSLAAMRIFRRCYWVDALGIDPKTRTAGTPTADVLLPTRNGKGRKKQETLPPALQAVVTLSQTLMQESKPIMLQGLVFTLGSSKRKEVRTTDNAASAQAGEGKTFSPGKESRIVPASWMEAAPSVLKEIEQSPAIFLLNPLGATLFSADDLAALSQRAVPTELCLLIPHKQVLTRLDSAQSSSVQANAAATALTTLLRSDRWKTLPLAEEQHRQAITGFIDLLAASLQRHFLLPLQSITFPLPTGPARVELIPFTLLFATRRHDSLYAMNDAVCRHRRCVEAESHRGVLSEAWFQSQQALHLADALDALARRIRQLGQAQRIRRWPDLRQQVLLEHFGRFVLDEYDQIIQQLILDGTVRCSWRHPPSDGSIVRIPGNEDTLQWR